MTPNNIYVQGSYIDIHDNENVYLSVDKGEVHLQNTISANNPAEMPSPEIPAELHTEEAGKLLALFTEDHQLATRRPVAGREGDTGIVLGRTPGHKASVATLRSAVGSETRLAAQSMEQGARPEQNGCLPEKAEIHNPMNTNVLT